MLNPLVWIVIAAFGMIGVMIKNYSDNKAVKAVAVERTEQKKEAEKRGGTGESVAQQIDKDSQVEDKKLDDQTTQVEQQAPKINPTSDRVIIPGEWMRKLGAIR